MKGFWETVLDWLLIGWLAVLEGAAWLHELSARVNWVTWILHSLVAIPVGLTGAAVYLVFVWLGFLPVIAAGLGANVTFWAWREGEQIAHRLIASVPLDRVDHVLDVLSPSVALPALAWWWCR